MVVVDTHAALWLTEEPELLSGEARKALTEARREGRIAIAGVTLRELAAQIVHGRIRVSTPALNYLQFVESVFRVIPIGARIAHRAFEFGPKYPKDPADRVIGATAVIHGARLVTKDEYIRASGEVDCIW